MSDESCDELQPLVFRVPLLLTCYFVERGELIAPIPLRVLGARELPVVPARYNARHLANAVTASANWRCGIMARASM